MSAGLMDCLGHYADLTFTVWAAICRTSACAKCFTWKSLDFHANDSTGGIYFHTNSSHKESFCHRGKSKLGIGLFIHELLREPLITQQHYFTKNRKKEKKTPLTRWKSNLIYSHMKNKSVKLPFITKNSKHLVQTICSQNEKQKCQITIFN